MRRVNTLLLKTVKGIATNLALKFQLVAHHLNGDIGGKSKAYSGWRRFNVLLPPCPRVTNQFAFAGGINQKYNVEEEQKGEQSSAKAPERLVTGYHSPQWSENLTRQQFFLHSIELFELRKNSPEEQRNQQMLHGTNIYLKSLNKAMWLCKILTPSRIFFFWLEEQGNWNFVDLGSMLNLKKLARFLLL